MEERAISNQHPWWQTAVMYQIYPRSFADTTGNGVGDLPGITAHLDDLVWLGVDGVWISPFFRSPMHDAGYDVSDYCDVDPVFGRLEDIDRLISEAHGRGLKVMIDWVPAHTSHEHPWFVEARSSRESPRRDWYVWRDARPDGALPNNWQAAFKKLPAWTFDEASGQYYLHSFLPEQPDLNWNNPDVVAAMHETLRFWLDRGVDGFRADVVHNIGKNPALADHDEKIAAIPHCALNDDPLTHDLLRDIRLLIDSYPGDRAMVGEVFLLNTEQVADYYGSNDELHLCFNFPPLFAPWQAEAWRGHIEKAASLLEPRGAWPTWVLSNHDQKRHRTRYGSEARARVAAMLLLTLRGTPFMYMGEELGLEDAVVPPERVVDPADRDGCRAPMPWLREAGHGWPDPSWLPLPPDAGELSHESQRDDPDSMLQLYKRLLSVRRSSTALRWGELELLEEDPRLLVYRRRHAADGEQGSDERFVVLNLSGDDVECATGVGRRIEASTSRLLEGKAYEGRVPADTGFILA
jgi:alpha-glucosidase